MIKCKEKDWKVLRAKLPEWQENYMDRMCKEYLGILTSNDSPSDRFWALEERIRKDKKKCGVCADMRRSMFYDNIFMLLDEGAITLSDLDDFSDEVKEIVQKYMQIVGADWS